MFLQLLQQKTNWATTERRAWTFAVIASAAIGFGFGNGHTTQGALSHVTWQLGQQKKVVAKLADVAGCQTLRAKVAKTDAIASENGANINLAAIPNCALPPKLAPKK